MRCLSGRNMVTSTLLPLDSTTFPFISTTWHTGLFISRSQSQLAVASWDTVSSGIVTHQLTCLRSHGQSRGSRQGMAWTRHSTERSTGIQKTRSCREAHGSLRGNFRQVENRLIEFVQLPLYRKQGFFVDLFVRRSNDVAVQVGLNCVTNKTTQ